MMVLILLQTTFCPFTIIILVQVSIKELKGFCVDTASRQHPLHNPWD